MTINEIPHGHGHYYKYPFVIWILNPFTRLLTIRPSWDLGEYIVRGRFPDNYPDRKSLIDLAKELRDFGFYPSDQAVMPAVLRIWEYYNSGAYIYPGQNVVIDPWYYKGDKPLEINWLTGEVVFPFYKEKFRKDQDGRRR